MVDFDSHAKGWDDDPEKVERARAIAKSIRKNIRLTPDMSAMEYGCGTGLLSFSLAPYLRRITLVDNSPAMFSVLEEKNRALGAGNMVPIRFDLLKDPLPRDRYHLICTVMTLHHMMDTEKVLRDFRQLLEHPGTLCVADLDKEDGSFHHEEDFVRHTGFNRKELQEQVLRTGFRKVTFKT